MPMTARFARWCGSRKWRRTPLQKWVSVAGAAWRAAAEQAVDIARIMDSDDVAVKLERELLGIGKVRPVIEEAEDEEEGE